MTALSEALVQVKARIDRYRGTGINEQNTKAALLEPVLRALGWDVEDLEEVQREYKPKAADKPVDYALLVLRTPRLFVEAKALGENLEDRRWANQIMGYAAVAGVAWVVLTNGDEYRIYYAHAPVPVEDKLYQTLRVTDHSARVEETLALLSKERLQNNDLAVFWRAQVVDRQIRPAIEGLFAPEPDPALIELLRTRTSDLSSEDVKAGLGRVLLRLDFPSEPHVSKEPYVEDSAAENGPRPTVHQQSSLPLSALSTQPGGPSHTGTGVSIRELIQAGLIKPPLTLAAEFKHRRVTAQVQDDGTILFNGATYASPSESAGYARNWVNGPPTDGRPYWSTNGWVFWTFQDNDGRYKRLSLLRQRYQTRDAI